MTRIFLRQPFASCFAFVFGFCIASGQAALAAGSMDDQPAASSTPAPVSSQGAPAKEKQAVNLPKIQSMLDAKRYAEALVEIETALATQPKHAELLKHKGFALREQGKFNEAVQAYVDALKIDPELHTAKEYLGVTYLKMGELKPAKQLYKELQASRPDLAKMMKAEADKLKLKL